MRLAVPRWVLVMRSLLPTVLLVAGCSWFEPYPDPTTRALADPMNWQPNFDNDDLSKSGSGTSHSDQKPMDKDMDHANNP